jgi:hypothetical protein
VARSSITPIIVAQVNGIEVTIRSRIKLAVDERLSLGVGQIAIVVGVTGNRPNTCDITDIKEIGNRKSDSEVCLTFSNLNGEGLVSNDIEEEAPRKTSAIVATHDGGLTVAELLGVRTA